MDIGKLHEVMHEINIAQTWCDQDGNKGPHIKTVSVSKVTLKKWAALLESALQNDSYEFRIVINTHDGQEHTKEITFRDWGPNENWPENADVVQRRVSALKKVDDYRRFKRVLCPEAKEIRLEKRHVGPWERVEE